ncbi:Hypothetical protein ADU72_0236 [Pediococcus damnosus]|uniref:Uncharacterized protein n=1 Tax=Pediococcus damnosus TaxID=51663 RepID=A0ABN4N6Y7_9LACO|nr:Hypothetical protein ADU72_0236 [Pediococcus damnosus]
MDGFDYPFHFGQPEQDYRNHQDKLFQAVIDKYPHAIVVANLTQLPLCSLILKNK